MLNKKLGHYMTVTEANFMTTTGIANGILTH